MHHGRTVGVIPAYKMHLLLARSTTYNIMYIKIFQAVPKRIRDLTFKEEINFSHVCSNLTENIFTNIVFGTANYFLESAARLKCMDN